MALSVQCNVIFLFDVHVWEKKKKKNFLIFYLFWGNLLKREKKRNKWDFRQGSGTRYFLKRTFFNNSNNGSLSVHINLFVVRTHEVIFFPPGMKFRILPFLLRIYVRWGIWSATTRDLYFRISPTNENMIV